MASRIPSTIYSPSPSSPFSLSLSSSFSLLLPLVLQGQLCLACPPSSSSSSSSHAMMVEENEGDMISEEIFQCVLVQSQSPSLMNQLLLSGLRLRNQTFYNRVPLIISKNGKYDNDNDNDNDCYFFVTLGNPLFPNNQCILSNRMLRMMNK